MRNALRNLIAGSPLEPAARSLYRRIRGGSDQNEIYDRQTIEIMRRTLARTSNCVDVGSYRGSILREMLRLAPQGRHHAFEPLPDACARLRHDFGAAVKIHNVALGNRTGPSSFRRVTSRPTYSGLLPRPYAHDETVDEIGVQVALLDDVIDATCPVAFVKIDVEGGECDVMEGGAMTLARSRPVIVFEHGADASSGYGKTSDDIYNVLHDACGLEISLLSAFLDRARPMSRREFNDQHYTGEHYYFVAHPGGEAN